MWLAQVNPSCEALTTKLDKSTPEPEEPEPEGKVKIGTDEHTTEEQWCSEQLYARLDQKTEGAALAMVRNQNTHGKSRGVLAWYRVMRESEGQVETKTSEITEKVFDSNRKAAAA